MNGKKYASKSFFKKRLIDWFVFDIGRNVWYSRNILDLGCGEGILLKKLELGTDCKITGVDWNQKALDEAKKRIPRGIFKKDDITTFKTRKRYDCVMCLEVMEHLKYIYLFLENLKSYKCKIVISVPNKNWFRLGNLLCLKNLTRFGEDPEHVNAWNEKGFKRLLEAYFDNVKIKRSGVWLIAVCEVSK